MNLIDSLDELAEELGEAYASILDEVSYSLMVVAMSYQEAMNLLGLTGTPTEENIKKAFRAKALEHHPDRGGDANMMIKLNVAKDVLMGKEKPRYSPPPPSSRDRWGVPYDETYRQPPPPPKKKTPIRVTLDDALRDAHVPRSGITWKFKTASGRGAPHADRLSHAFVLYGTDDISGAHLFLGIHYLAYSNAVTGDDVEKYTAYFKIYKNAVALPTLAPKAIREMWKNFEGIGKYSAKIHLIKDGNGTSNILEAVKSYTQPVAFKHAMDIMGEQIPKSWKKTLSVVVKLSERPESWSKPKYSFLRYAITFVINGKPYELSEKGSDFFTLNYITKVFGRYFYGGSMKDISRLRKPFKKKMLQDLLVAFKQSGEPKEVLDALEQLEAKTK